MKRINSLLLPPKFRDQHRQIEATNHPWCTSNPSTFMTLFFSGFRVKITGRWEGTCTYTYTNKTYSQSSSAHLQKYKKSLMGNIDTPSGIGGNKSQPLECTIMDKSTCVWDESICFMCLVSELTENVIAALASSRKAIPRISSQHVYCTPPPLYFPNNFTATKGLKELAEMP